MGRLPQGRAYEALLFHGFKMKKHWIWKNFVNGNPEYWIFDNPYPCHPNGDPMTVGEPCGYGIFKGSQNGRLDRSEEYALNQCKAALAYEKRSKGTNTEEEL